MRVLDSAPNVEGVARLKHHPDRAVAYIRTSTSRQDLSPLAQREAVTDWARRNGVTVEAVHEDIGVSGGVHPLEREGFGAALHSLGVYRAGMLIVARIDRLSRSTLDFAVVDDHLAKQGRRLVSADGVANDDTPEAKLIRGVLANVAEYERRLIGARTKAALRAKRRRGERTSHALPYGFSLDPANPKLLVANHIERAALRRAGELRRQGLGYRDVAAALNAEGRPHRGNGWSERNVGRLLRQHPEGFLSPAP